MKTFMILFTHDSMAMRKIKFDLLYYQTEKFKKKNHKITQLLIKI